MLAEISSYRQQLLSLDHQVYEKTYRFTDPSYSTPFIGNPIHTLLCLHICVFRPTSITSQSAVEVKR